MMFQNFCKNLFDELTPVSDHKISFSGGLSDNMNHLTESDPYLFIITSGSTVFFFDFDIDSGGPITTFDLFVFLIASVLLIFSISSG